MDGKRLIEKIRLRNILSFGERIIEKKSPSSIDLQKLLEGYKQGEEIELQSLNIIIGQNASGKSNFVDVIKLLRSAAQDKGLINFISRSGGISEWIWKGDKKTTWAEIVVTTSQGISRSSYTLVDYELKFEELYSRLEIKDERIISKDLVVHSRKEILSDKKNKIKISDEETILSNMGWIEFFGKGAELQDNFTEIKLYTDLQTNRKVELRKPQVPDAPNDFLEEDAANLALVLNDLEHRGNTKDKIVENLKKFNPRIKDYSIRILGGTVQLFIREEDLEKPISAMRLSDGTLRYLCLLAILCHPEPPPLICIEEPETGLHPDILPTIAELMKEARHRTQLIVTTHSDILVSAFSDMPEAVLVCEKDEDGTHFKRLEAEKLKVWLEEYTLGEAWLRGAIGGTRW